MAPRAGTDGDIFTMGVTEPEARDAPITRTVAPLTPGSCGASRKTTSAPVPTSSRQIANFDQSPCPSHDGLRGGCRQVKSHETVADVAAGRMVLVAGSAYGNRAMGYPGLDGNHVRDEVDLSKPAANRPQRWPMQASTYPKSAQPERGAVVERALCHNRFQTRLRGGRAQCLESLALEHHAVNRTRPNLRCSVSFMGTG